MSDTDVQAIAQAIHDTRPKWRDDYDYARAVLAVLPTLGYAHRDALEGSHAIGYREGYKDGAAKAEKNERRGYRRGVEDAIAAVEALGCHDAFPWMLARGHAVDALRRLGDAAD